MQKSQYQYNDACFLPDILLSSIEEFEKASAETMYDQQLKMILFNYKMILNGLYFVAVSSIRTEKTAAIPIERNVRL